MYAHMVLPKSEYKKSRIFIDENVIKLKIKYNGV